MGVLLSVWQNNARSHGSVTLVDQLIRSVCSPVSVSSGAVGRALNDYTMGAIRGSHLQDENARLKRQLNALSMYSDTVQRLQSEVDSLRKLQGLPETYNKQKIRTDITGFFLNQNRLTIGVGRNKGIKVGMPVVCADGLVGTIQAVGPSDAQVRLLTTAGVQLSAIIPSHTPPAKGLLIGNNSSTLQMSFPSATTTVVSGDIVTTSGFSVVIPRGIPIGRILTVESQPELGSSRAKILPAVDVSTLREVVVLK